MKPIVRCVFVIAGLLTAEAAFSQDFKSQAAAAASQWDNTFNSGDASKVAQGYTKSAVILPAGGQQVPARQPLAARSPSPQGGRYRTEGSPGSAQRQEERTTAQGHVRWRA